MRQRALVLVAVAGPVAYHWLSSTPPILRYISPIYQDEETQAVFYGSLPDRRVHHLVAYYWHCTADHIERHHLAVRRRRPDDVVHHLVNELDVLEGLAARGVPATFVSTNSFLDERLIVIDPGVRKRFDAVYVARMSPFKRHGLAHRVDRLLVVGGLTGVTDTWEHLHSLRRAMPHAGFA